MGHACIAFEMESADDAYKHIMDNREVVERYGDKCGDNWLHTWDDGNRALWRCKACGGYVLLQRSEFHSAKDDSYYSDYFPVSGPEEAAELNRTLNGWHIEQEFGRRYLIQDNLNAPHWKG